MMLQNAWYKFRNRRDSFGSWLQRFQSMVVGGGGGEQLIVVARKQSANAVSSFSPFMPSVDLTIVPSTLRQGSTLS